MICTKVRVLVAVSVLLAGCATTGGAAVKDCAAQVTPALVATAAGALVGQDYQAAVERELGGLAACLVVAAVEAAVDQAKHIKLSGGVDQAAIARHGDAWLAAQRRAPPPPT